MTLAVVFVVWDYVGILYVGDRFSILHVHMCVYYTHVVSV